MLSSRRTCAASGLRTCRSSDPVSSPARLTRCSGGARRAGDPGGGPSATMLARVAGRSHGAVAVSSSSVLARLRDGIPAARRAGHQRAGRAGRLGGDHRGLCEEPLLFAERGGLPDLGPHAGRHPGRAGPGAGYLVAPQRQDLGDLVVGQQDVHQAAEPIRRGGHRRGGVADRGGGGGGGRHQLAVHDHHLDALLRGQRLQDAVVRHPVRPARPSRRARPGWTAGTGREAAAPRPCHRANAAAELAVQPMVGHGGHVHVGVGGR